MAEKNDTEVLIGGRVYTLRGYESEEYLQKIALYINNKMSEYNKIEGYRMQPRETQAVLLELNIADDYFKIKKELDKLEDEIAARDKEIYKLKHELISTQMRLDTAENMLKKVKQDKK